MEGKRWRLTDGARISGGSVLYKMVGRRGESVRRAGANRGAVSQIEPLQQEKKNKKNGVVAWRSYSFRASAPAHPAACGRSVAPRSALPILCALGTEKNMLSEGGPAREEEARGLSKCHGAGELVIVAMTT